ncbi:hypothetical protein FRB99_004247 [Tulasnella sp. 403]|nr:hypothetical protein FRB99_004247 [Tulasnella sp. 403]
MPPSLFSTTRPPCTRSNHLRLLLLATIAFSPDPASAWIFGKWLARTDRAALQRRDTPQFGFFDPHLKDNGNMLTPIDKGHDIIVNGYNLARDWLVGNATQVAFADPNPLSFVPTPDEIASSSSMSVASLGSIASTASVASVASLASISSLQALTRTSIAGNSTSLPPSSVAPTPTPTPTPTPAPAAQPNILLNASGGTGNIAPVPGGQFIGTTSANNYTYQTTATYTTGLLGNTSTGVNHYITVEEGGRPAMDGMVAVLVVKIISRPDGESAAFATAAPSFSALFLTVLSSFLLISS